MKESAEEMARREKLTRYLLGETEDEERLEIEKLCNRDDDWRKDKQLVSKTLSLMEEACSQPLEELQGQTRKLTEEQRSKALSALENHALDKPSSEPELTKEKSDSSEAKKIKLNFWIPLGAAATAMIIAYLGSEERSKITETASVESSPKNEGKEGGDSFVMQDKASAEVDLALEERIQEGAHEILAKRTAKEVLAMTDSDSVPPSQTDKPTSEKELTGKADEGGTLNESLPLLSERGQPMPIAAKTSAPPIAASEPRLSPNGLYNALRNPLKAFLLTLDGDSLGKVTIHSLTDTETLSIERADWPNPSRIFALRSEIYELRLFAQEGEIYVLRGELKKNNELSRTSAPSIYEFSFSQAWILGKNEIRKEIAIPASR